MPTFEAFCAKQNETYAVIRRNEREKTCVTGIEPDPGLTYRRGGFYLSFIHAARLNTVAATFSAGVNQFVPAMVYQRQDLHTTAGSLAGSVQDHFYIDLEDATHRHSLASMVQIAHAAASRILVNQAEIRFDELPIITPQNIVVLGRPNESFVEAVNTVLESAQECGVELSPPWGAHMTVSRFAAARKPSELDALFTYRDMELPWGASRLVGIAAGYVLRRPQERHVVDLRETPGPFHSARFFPFATYS